MNYAQIENGVVVNVIVADEAFAAENGLVPLSAGAGINWLFSNGVFTPPPQVPVTENDGAIPPPPESGAYMWDAQTASWVPVPAI